MRTFYTTVYTTASLPECMGEAMRASELVGHHCYGWGRHCSMGKTSASRGVGIAKVKKTIEQYEHLDKMRKKNPQASLVTPETDWDGEKKDYAYDPHLDPQLMWACKAEHTSFEVPTVSLHVHERIDPHTIIEAVENRHGEVEMEQPALFETPEENPPLRQAIDFYEHSWSNRMIAGDS